MTTAAEPAKHQHNWLQSLCNAICTKGLPEVATHKYKEKAADVCIETTIVTKKWTSLLCMEITAAKFPCELVIQL